MNGLPLVDVVVLNYNGKRFLDECFQSLMQGTYPNFNIYLLDNASTDDDVAYVMSQYPSVKIIRNPLNNGYCAAYNLAFAQCDGKYIVCLNNDVTTAPDWLEHLVALAEADESIGALQPKLLSYFDEKKFEYAGASGGMMDVYGYPFLRGRLFDTMEDDHGQYDDVVEVFWASGAAMFVRKSALAHSGLLDEDIVHHMDEIDLCWRLRMAGYRQLVQPKSIIRHIGGATIPTASFKKIYWNHRNALYLMIKNYEAANMIRFTAVHVLLDYVAIVRALLTGNLTMARGVCAAHLWIIGRLKLLGKKRKEAQKLRRRSDREVMHYMYPKSVVWQYFARGRKKFSQLAKIKTHEYNPNTRST